MNVKSLYYELDNYANVISLINKAIRYLQLKESIKIYDEYLQYEENCFAVKLDYFLEHSDNFTQHVNLKIISRLYESNNMNFYFYINRFYNIEREIIENINGWKRFI